MGGKLIAWEPDPINIEMVMERFRAEKVDNYCLIEKALWNQKETLNFNVDKSDSAIDVNGKLHKEINQFWQLAYIINRKICGNCLL